MKKWNVVIVLGSAQFVMVLDGTVMNVSISTVVSDLDTSVTAMQAAITFYTLTMAAFMLLGAKLGDVWGRRRAFVIGSCVYAAGSLITALSPSVGFLFLGWSIIEGLGAVLVSPRSPHSSPTTTEVLSASPPSPSSAPCRVRRSRPVRSSAGR